MTSTPDEPVERKVIWKSRTRARCAEESEEFEIVNELPESEDDLVDYYVPERRSLEIKAVESKTHPLYQK